MSFSEIDLTVKMSSAQSGWQNVSHQQNSFKDYLTQTVTLHEWPKIIIRKIELILSMKFMITA